jgi:hypothetical protein
MSVIESAELDQPTYAPGAPATITVKGDWGRIDDLTAATDDGVTFPAQLTLIRPVSITDPTGRAWQLVSNSGNEAVFTSVA